jgi:hypothetical protein
MGESVEEGHLELGERALRIRKKMKKRKQEIEKTI